MIKSITTGVLATTLVATSVFAQDNGGQKIIPPGDERGSEWEQQVRGMRQEYREERRGRREEFREDMKDARGEFREGMKERREWMMHNASGTASGTMPTPWKNLREDMKDARKDFKDGMKDMRNKMKDEMRGMMPPRMASLTATQTAAIAGKLGISVDVLNAQLASGTKLKDIIKDKIKPEEMKAILPPKVASMTRAVQEQGFFGNFRSRLFGPREIEVQQSQNEFGEIEESTRPIPGSGLLRRLFNW